VVAALRVSAGCLFLKTVVKGGKMGHPLSILIKPASGRCSMRCSYCFYRDEQGRRQDADRGMMDEGILGLILEKAFAEGEGRISVAFQGGEPTLRGISFFEHAFHAAAEMNVRNVPIQWSFQTNGLALDHAWCELFRSNGVLVGLSVDGTRAMHDQFRKDASGEGTYERTVRAAGLLAEHGVSFNILTVVTHALAGQAQEVYRSYRRHGWMWQQYIPCLDRLGAEGGVSFPWHLGEEEYAEFLCGLFDCWQDDLLEGHAPHIRQLDNWMGILLGRAPEACDMRGACSVQYAFEADGSCYPCDFFMLDQFCLGNIEETGFGGFDRARKRLGFIERSAALPQRCQRCRYVFLCRGGCARVRDAEGLFAHCDAMQLFFGRKLPEMLALRDRLLL
jgi:uncharacterized protein